LLLCINPYRFKSCAAADAQLFTGMIIALSSPKCPTGVQLLNTFRTITLTLTFSGVAFIAFLYQPDLSGIVITS
jgi:hypothetical protein